MVDAPAGCRRKWRAVLQDGGKEAERGARLVPLTAGKEQLHAHGHTELSRVFSPFLLYCESWG